MRRFRGRKLRSQKRNSEKTSFSFSARNTARQCACCRSAAHRTPLMATRWNFAEGPTSARQVRSVHFGLGKKKPSRLGRGALKRSPVTRRGRGPRKKLRDNKRSSRPSRARNPTFPHCLLLKRKPTPLKC